MPGHHSLKPGSPVSVFTTPDSELVLGCGVVHAIAADGTVEVHLEWRLADGRPATLFAQPECLRLASPVTKIGAAVAVTAANSAGTRMIGNGVFARGVVAGVRNPDMVCVHLQWNLADGSPATLHTPAANLFELAAAEQAEAARKARALRIARGRHAAKFKSRTKVVVLSSDGSGRAFCAGTVTKLRYIDRSCVVDLPWKLADGTAARLYTQADLLRLPNREESLHHATTLKDRGGALFAKKEYFSALQTYVNSLEYVQQWIVRKRTEPMAKLQAFFELQQKLFGNVAWCMFNRESYAQCARFCTRVLEMFEDTPQGKIPEDTGMRAKYLYLRGQALLADVSSATYLRDAARDYEAGKKLVAAHAAARGLAGKFEKLGKKIAAAEVRKREKKAKFAKGLAFGVRKKPASGAASPAGEDKALPKKKTTKKKTKKKTTKGQEKKAKKTKKQKSSATEKAPAPGAAPESSRTVAAGPAAAPGAARSPSAAGSSNGNSSADAGADADTSGAAAAAAAGAGAAASPKDGKKKTKKSRRSSKSGSKKAGGNKRKGGSKGIPGWVAPVVAAGVVAAGLAVFFGSGSSDNSSGGGGGGAASRQAAR